MELRINTDIKLDVPSVKVEKPKIPTPKPLKPKYKKPEAPKELSRKMNIKSNPIKVKEPSRIVVKKVPHKIVSKPVHYPSKDISKVEGENQYNLMRNTTNNPQAPKVINTSQWGRTVVNIPKKSPPVVEKKQDTNSLIGESYTDPMINMNDVHDTFLNVLHDGSKHTLQKNGR